MGGEREREELERCICPSVRRIKNLTKKPSAALYWRLSPVLLTIQLRLNTLNCHVPFSSFFTVSSCMEKQHGNTHMCIFNASSLLSLSLSLSLEVIFHFEVEITKVTSQYTSTD